MEAGSTINEFEDKYDGKVTCLNISFLSLLIFETIKGPCNYVSRFSEKTLGGGNRENPTEGVEISYSKFKGKVVLINNVATM